MIKILDVDEDVLVDEAEDDIGGELLRDVGEGVRVAVEEAGLAVVDCVHAYLRLLITRAHHSLYVHVA